MTKKYKRYPKHGETVRVYVDPLEPSAKSVVRFNGTVTTINDVGRGPIYSLEGCNADTGVPFWFVKDWLTIIENE